MIIYLLASEEFDSAQMFHDAGEAFDTYNHYFDKYPKNDFRLLGIDCQKNVIKEISTNKKVVSLEGEELAEYANRILKGRKISVKGSLPLRKTSDDTSTGISYSKEDKTYYIGFQKIKTMYGWDTNIIKELITSGHHYHQEDGKDLEITIKALDYAYRTCKTTMWWRNSRKCKR